MILFRTTITLSENLKEGEITGEEMGGISFVENDLTEGNQHKICFKIVASISDSISVGIGDPESVKSKGYHLDGNC